MMNDYREIPLTQGQITIVDANDYEWLMQWKWHANWNPKLKRFYAKRNENLPDGRQRALWMHRAILGLEYGDPRQVDHIECSQTLDNRRSNIRIASRSQNCMNKGLRRDNRSGYKGVSFAKNISKWRSHIFVNGKQIHLGNFLDPVEAHQAFCAAALKYHGEFARVA